MKITIEIEILKTVDKRRLQNIVGALVPDIINSVDSGEKEWFVGREIYGVDVQMDIKRSEDASTQDFSVNEIQNVLDEFTDEAPGFYIKKNFIERLEENKKLSKS